MFSPPFLEQLTQGPLEALLSCQFSEIVNDILEKDTAEKGILGGAVPSRNSKRFDEFVLTQDGGPLKEWGNGK